MTGSDSSDLWYADGLRFECSRCGDCCRGPGYVWVSAGESDRLAEHLDLTSDRFARRFLRTVSGRLALIDNPAGDCVFWDNGCTVYAARPTQCRTFPFWSQNLAHPGSWDRTVRACPGAGEGRLYNRDEIERLRLGRGRTTAEGDDG